MRKLLIGLGVILVVLVGIVIAVPFFVSGETLKPRIVAAVRDATGRDFAIDGALSLHVFPSLAVEGENARLANVAGGTQPNLVTLGALRVSLKLLPLLRGEIAIDAFRLVRPTINLEVDREGRGNWSFGPVTAAASGGTQSAGGSPSAVALSQLRLGDVALVDGTVTYRDDRTGKTETLAAVGATVRLPSLDDPLAVDGTATWHDKPVTIRLGLAKLRALLVGAATEASLTLAGPDLRLALDGTLTGGGTPGLAGSVDLATPSIRNLAAWAGQKLDMPGSGLGPFDVKGKLVASAGKIALSDVAVGLDAIRATGAVTVMTGGARPRLDGSLDVDTLDLNPYLPPPAPAPASTVGAGPAGPAGWSDAPIDATALKAADLHLALGAGAIKFRKIEIGKSTLGVSVDDGHLVADLSQMALYGGSGRGKVAIDGSSAAGTGLDLAFKIAGIQADPLLQATIDMDRLSGTGALDLSVAGRGRSERAIIASLGGSGTMKFTDGAIKGIDLGAMARNVSTAFTGGGGSQKTDFSELGGSFTIAAGILKNDDLMLLSPLLRVTGAGTVDLPRQSVDYRVEPKLVASLEGQGGAADARGLAVPVIVSGPWSNLSYRPDLAGILKQKIDPKALLGGVAGGSTGTAPKPADMLKGLLGGH